MEAGLPTVPRELCMKVTFPDDPRIFEIFKSLPPIFEVERRESMVTVYCPIGYEFRRDFHGFKVREFYRVYRALQVENGRKIWKHDSIILEPKKKTVLVFMAPGEIFLLKVLAERADESLSEYIRVAALTRMARELGL
jgi:hypothetical protein